MNHYQAGYLRYFLPWLALALIPAALAVLSNGGHEWLLESLPRLLLAALGIASET